MTEDFDPVIRLTKTVIKFKGEVELPYADDRGSYDHWLVGTIKEAIEAGPETDNIFEALNLSWKIKEKSLRDGGWREIAEQVTKEWRACLAVKKELNGDLELLSIQKGQLKEDLVEAQRLITVLKAQAVRMEKDVDRYLILRRGGTRAGIWGGSFDEYFTGESLDTLCDSALQETEK